ncbi:unnamed protein product [Clonostachys byssicola]|uniref:Uncharacterized protein n=1 Tax=Clonostachys byssicola TaxID=160290 RepID=A0A9N9Y322_9HYPO|nr:unnamed protein product [Clonostachys byssicola]
MLSDFKLWKEHVESNIVAPTVDDHMCCLEACIQIVHLTGQVLDLSKMGDFMTRDEKRKRKGEFERKFEYLKGWFEDHMEGLPEPERESLKNGLEEAKETFEASMELLD